VNMEWPPAGDFQVTIRLRKVNQYDAIVIGETGYVQQNQMEMVVFFTLLAKGSARSSMLTASDLPFSKWEKVFKGLIRNAAVADRFVKHSIILGSTMPSYCV
jgi:DNA replication protein DnaC